jgi:hypothetical protein
VFLYEMKTAANYMKCSRLLAGVLLALPLAAQGQPSALPAFRATADRLATPEPSLTRFDLDFSGGTPQELIAAIQKAMARPLNAIVPDEFAGEKLPALKMKNVTVPQLFEALGAASHKNEVMKSGPAGGSFPVPGSYQFVSTFVSTSYGFRTQGVPTDDSIWFFFVERPLPPATPIPEKTCRFYSLAPYLDRGATVDDITTAIETGWKMLGYPSPPAIRFHKDTKLLIAVGEASKLEIIDAVLKAMDVPKTKPATSAPASANKPPEKPKNEE